MTVNIYPTIVMENDLSPDIGYGSDIDDICEEIINATKGWGANKQRVIDAIATCDSTKRYQIYHRYSELNDQKKKLDELIKSEFGNSNDFGLALKFLVLPSDYSECAMIRKATAGIGASTNIIWSILVGRSNEEMERIKKVYFTKYTKDLGKMLASELGGDMERIIFNCLQASEEIYDPQYHTPQKVIEDMEEIHDKGQGKWGTDEKGIFKILCASPSEHLQNINREYADKYGYSLHKAMEKELGGMLEGNVQKAVLHLIGMKLKPYETIAALMKSACAGFGTDELLLTCCIIRYQPIMADVMSAHIELYGKTIHERVKSEVSGPYKTLLLTILNTVWPEEG